MVIAAILAAVVWQLLWPPLIGLADNGDFPRIVARFNIGHISDKYEDRYFEYFQSKYRIDPRDRWDSGFVSSQTLLVAVALPLNHLFSQLGFFDIRCLAAVHVALELAAAWLLLAYAPVYGPIAREVLLGIVFLAFTDVGYVAYFNSFYSEPGSFVFLLLTLGAILMTIARPTKGALAGLFVAGLLFITSKPQNVPAGFILAAYSLRLCALRADKAWRWMCAGIAFVLAWSSVYYFTFRPRDITVKPAQYLSVFGEILPYSSTPRQDLIELGLDAKLLKYSGTSPWAPDAPTNDPDFQRSFFEKISFTKMIRFHLSHPVRLLETLDRCARYAPELQPWVGNYEKSEGRFPWARSRSFNLWSSLREKYSPGSLKSFGLFFTANYVAIVLLYRRTGSLRNRLMLELQGALLLVAIIQFSTVAIGVGTHEATKHLFLFDLLVDLCFATCLLCLVTIVTERN